MIDITTESEMNRVAIFTTMTLLLVTFLPLSAQSAPRPAQLAVAKTVFISNATMHNGSANDEFYDAFYADVQALNRFSVAANPANADLILEFTSVNGGFTLRILDPRSTVVLWSIGESFNLAARAATVLKNEHAALLNLAGDLKQICLPAN